MPGTRRPQQHQPPEGRGRARGLCVEDKPFGIANFNMEISFQSFFFFLPLFQETFCMRYLRFRNILILLEVQEVSSLEKSRSLTLRNS